jgi:hypothetical protein
MAGVQLLMDGTVVEMKDATIEFEWRDETENDEHGSRFLEVRIHNDSGGHCLIVLRNPKLMIIGGEEQEL